MDRLKIRYLSFWEVEVYSLVLSGSFLLQDYSPLRPTYPLSLIRLEKSYFGDFQPVDCSLFWELSFLFWGLWGKKKSSYRDTQAKH